MLRKRSHRIKFQLHSVNSPPASFCANQFFFRSPDKQSTSCKALGKSYSPIAEIDGNSVFSSSFDKPRKPCRDGHNCVLQHSNPAEHNAIFSHPCRWSELCRDLHKNAEHARQFTHEMHQATPCKFDGHQCAQLTNPEHRRRYRHEGLPDFLIPCRYRDQCRDQSHEHLQQFEHPTPFHQSTGITQPRTASSTQQGFTQRGSTQQGSTQPGFSQRESTPQLFTQRESTQQGFTQLGSFQPGSTQPVFTRRGSTPQGSTQRVCRYGSECRQQTDSNHCSQFTHPTASISTLPKPTASLPSSVHDDRDDMSRAYRIGATLAMEKLSQRDQTAIQNMAHDAIVVVPGTYDHIHRVFDSLQIKYITVKQEELSTYSFRPDQTVYINCASHFPAAAAQRMREHVERGLHLVTTDWALRNVLQVSFADFVRHTGQSTADEVVGIQVVDPNHPLVHGFLPASKHAEPQWWLEASSQPIEIVDKRRVRVLIRSQTLGQKYRSDAVLVTFDCGKGNVIHMISHFYLQRSETRDARHQLSAKQYAMDSKASTATAELVAKQGQNLNYAQIQSSSTSAQFIYNQISRRLNP